MGVGLFPSHACYAQVSQGRIPQSPDPFRPRSTRMPYQQLPRWAVAAVDKVAGGIRMVGICHNVQLLL
jgi:hypothetical protein